MKSILIVLGVFIITLWVACEKAAEKTGESQTSGSAEAILYSAPDIWTEEIPGSAMRKTQFRLPGKGDSDAAELAVFHFPGTGGSVEANLERWYSQFAQPDGSSTRDRVEKRVIDVQGLEVTVVYTAGTYLQSSSPMMSGPVEEKPGYALLAAIVETSQGPWFFKTVGPVQTIDMHREEFINFIKTFRKSPGLK